MAETAPPTHNTVSIDTFVQQWSPWQEELLSTSPKAQKSLARELYLASLPKLPNSPNFFSQIELNALKSGSQKALQRVYQNIHIPSKNKANNTTRHLDLSYQNIHFIPNKIAYLQELRYLSLSHNRIQVLNPLLTSCKKLQKLDLSSNGLQQLPFGLSYLTQIKELVLADNNLKNLPTHLSKLTNLKNLDISNVHSGMANYYNNIQYFPKVLTKMPQLEKLFLEKLPLSYLPASIQQMQGLKVLSLNGNRALNLNQVFINLAKVPNLIALDLSFIGQRTLPSSIQKLQHLKVLIWHEEQQKNRAFIEETLRAWLPNTQIFYGKKGVATPFLRGNTITTLSNLDSK